MPEEAAHPTVFISYSHDSVEHVDRVLNLADRLVSEGIDCILDQWQGSPSEGWTRWMDREIRAADFVLMICTETYCDRVNGEKDENAGMGVRWEGNLVYQSIYDAGSRNDRFIPVLLEGGDPGHIPTPLKGVTFYRLDSEVGYEALYRRLTNQPENLKPKLGKLRTLPPRERKTDFLRQFQPDSHPSGELEAPERPAGLRTPPQSEPLRGTSGSSYRLATVRPFQQGRISVLYEGLSEKGEVVCLKLFREVPRTSAGRDVQEFFAELEAQQSLKHPNILPVLDYGEGGETDPGPFLVYPLCAGGNLRRLIEGRVFIPLPEALPLLDQVAGALDFAHSRGFYHGDIKPENVLLDETRSRALLSDFGMARRFPIREATTVAGRDDGGIGGTSAYLSPEELAEHKQTRRSDIYSFALVACELLTGQLPFNPDLPLYQQVRAKVEGKLLKPAALNSQLSADVSAVLELGLAVNPAARPKTASQLCGMIADPTTAPRGAKSRWTSLRKLFGG